MYSLPRVVITGVGLTAPNGNNLAEFRQALLQGKSGVQPYEIRYFGKTLAGICNFEATRYQKRKDLRRGTRAGSISIYCAHEALKDAGIGWDGVDKSRVGVYVGTTEHGNVETETEIYEVSKQNYNLDFWTHHHNPRTVANNPAGEVTLSLGITGPAYAIGAACAAGNLGVIHATQMLQLGEVDLAFGGGVSESIHTFGIFAGFKQQGALAHREDPTKASRPFDKARNGIVVAEGGCLYTLERLDDALKRGAKIYAEIAGWHVNSDASDYVLPNSERQMQCMRAAIKRAGMQPGDVDIVNTHATSTPSGDEMEAAAVNAVFGDYDGVHVNNTKSYIGHAMGAAGALELAGNLPSFEDGVVHPTINIDELDPECAVRGLVINQPKQAGEVKTIMNMSFGMLGINSALIVKKYE
ncbi:MAG: beta-ketoacyl-[acyl-carrier-protein] synthase family protein [Planctomycetes bacterium]|nr:beta-ketoacyl-[acyl-carrier-protein] synthase family protein [Planctomycetota bacterium]MCB9934621.1 beta-ketoacyl-[acyl-carrier-protein] synthase family protein [Planctomycetota bacterium]